VLALGLHSTAAAGASKAQQRETAKRDRAAAQEESSSVESWGVVRAVVSASRVVVVTPDEARLDVRLLGVEPPAPPRPLQQSAPTVRGQPFGREAVQYLRDLVLDKQVQLETYGKDRQGRTLAVVRLGDINVNLTLVKEGLAWMSPAISVPRVRAELQVAERQAHVGKYGLWALPSPQQPWEYRKQHHLPAE
jgi:endonuclease YncB( thermonuclease family)